MPTASLANDALQIIGEQASTHWTLLMQGSHPQSKLAAGKYINHGSFRCTGYYLAFIALL